MNKLTLEPEAQIGALAQKARQAARGLSLSSEAKRNDALKAIAEGLRQPQAIEQILKANEIDVKDGREKGLSDAMIDRLILTEQRIEAMAKGVMEIIALADPVGQVLDQWQRPNGLQIERVATPIGVIGVIFESRPNVTVDAAALCLKSGNAVILRGGSDSLHSVTAIHQIIKAGLSEVGLDANAVQVVTSKDRALVGAMLAAHGKLDLIIPRGGKTLTERVMAEAKVPVLAHLEGVVHQYIHAEADLDKALKLVINSKMRRTGICGALECLVIDRVIADALLPKLADELAELGCQLLGEADARALSDHITPITQEDYGCEFLSPILAIKLVDGVEDALGFIITHSSQHTDGIITENQAVANQFLTTIDSAILNHNASTQFADGGEFGMGGEIGIATGKLHARGPIGVAQLCCFNYIGCVAMVNAALNRKIEPNRKIGLLGGSFNPAHSGHIAVSTAAFKYLGLDQIWWLVSPQNPLKSSQEMADFTVRFDQAKQITARYPYIHVSDFEAQAGYHYSLHTMMALNSLYSRHCRFVFLIGSDNLLQLPQWFGWQQLIKQMPIAVFPRQPAHLKTANSVLTSRMVNHCYYGAQARNLALQSAPAFGFIPMAFNQLSATQLRC